MKKERWMQIITASQEHTIDTYIPRDLETPLHSNKIISVIGSRRCGKTTYLFHLMDQLKKQSIPPHSLIYINMENPSLFPLKPTDLMDMMEAYHLLYPSMIQDKKYLFLDEIQLVPDWEIAVRYLYDAENCQIWLSGSTSHLLSRDISTHLRGRSISYTLYPFSFRELVRYNNIDVQDPKLLYSSARFAIQKLYASYLQYGGYPEVLQTDHKDEKNRILQEYFETIFFKDLIDRYHIRNIQLMRELIKFLFTAIGSRFSVESYYRTIKQTYPVSKQTIFNYLQYLEDIFMFFPVKKYANSLKEQTKSFKKIYALDLGFHHIGGFEVIPSNGHRLENAVYIELLQRASKNPMLEIYYDRQLKEQEVDFMVKEGSKWVALYQVCVNLSRETTFKREIRSLLLAKEKYHPQDIYIITEEEEEIPFPYPEEIHIIPFWKWALTE
jgi:predicted AAA+ superfamily ATPase